MTNNHDIPETMTHFLEFAGICLNISKGNGKIETHG